MELQLFMITLIILILSRNMFSVRVESAEKILLLGDQFSSNLACLPLGKK